jgi:hypothetical protein
MPVILTSQEADSRRIVVKSQLQTNSLQDPISRIPGTKKGLKR